MNFIEDSIDSETNYFRTFALELDYQEQKRVRQNYWDALADVGGFHDGLFLIMNSLLAPFVAHRFLMDLVSDSK